MTSDKNGEESVERDAGAGLPPVPAGGFAASERGSVESSESGERGRGGRPVLDAEEGDDGRRAERGERRGGGRSAGEAAGPAARRPSGEVGDASTSAGLEVLNAVGRAEAVATLLACCASHRWAERMAGLRPFPLLEAVLAAAEETWWRLDLADWHEAFAAHPRIGERAAAHPAPGDRGWSAGEQAGAAGMEASRAARLAEANRQYEERFGWVYLVCATGRSGDEMLEILERRLGGDPEHELRVAAAEQAKITRLRLEKLLAELGGWR